MNYRPLSAFVPLILVFACGCGSSIEQAGSSATGKVTLDGQPLPGGIVQFSPVDKASRAAFGTIQSDGTFEVASSAGVAGVDPGEYRVSVEYTPEATPDAQGNVPEEESPVPEKYADAETSGLVVTVKVGEQNDLVIELVSGGK